MVLGKLLCVEVSASNRVTRGVRNSKKAQAEYSKSAIRDHWSTSKKLAVDQLRNPKIAYDDLSFNKF